MRIYGVDCALHRVKCQSKIKTTNRLMTGKHRISESRASSLRGNIAEDRKAKTILDFAFCFSLQPWPGSVDFED
jgi:hypothetical protein